jgi:hypothetical protein
MLESVAKGKDKTSHLGYFIFCKGVQNLENNRERNKEIDEKSTDDENSQSKRLGLDHACTLVMVNDEIH